MTAQQAIQCLAHHEYARWALDALYQAVLARVQELDPNYEEPTHLDRTSLEEWIESGEYDGTETVESLAHEWLSGGEEVPTA